METRKVNSPESKKNFMECGFSVETKHFGTISARPDQIITVTQGLLGFPDSHRYILIEHKQESPFLWFQSVDNPALAFVIIDPRCFMPDYQIGKLNGCLRELGAESINDLQIFVVVTIPRGRPQDMTANLLGPLLINTKTRRGKQLVLDNPRLSHQHRIIKQ
ncbi:MAG: flagellar assembly protein FliW [Desulfobacca sp.]|nr:flagellar assembly protein FliW [Desulfobacca sp.]